MDWVIAVRRQIEQKLKLKKGSEGKRLKLDEIRRLRGRRGEEWFVCSVWANEQCMAGWEDEGGFCAEENVADMDAGNLFFPSWAKLTLYLLPFPAEGR